jgi:hypothetical protein
MPMDTATQVIIFIVALLISSGFLALVIVLVPTIKELKALFIDLQKTSTEVREIAGEMKKISANVEGKLDGIDSVLSNSQKIVSNFGRAYSVLNSPALKNAEWLALIPAIIMGWKAVSKMKRRKDER